MAKVSFTKLGLNKNQEVAHVEHNGQVIEVKQYLPVNDKLILISNVINSASDGSFENPVKVDVFTALEILYAYTNVNFTDKQKEDPCKLYDLFNGSGLLDEIYSAIPEVEYNEIMSGIHRCIHALYEYRNSIMGILETISTSYDNVNLELEDIQNRLTDPESLALLKQILPLLGPSA